jgi:hypothetical protein
VNKRRGSLRPIVEQRAKLVRSLRELLGAIGLDAEYGEARGEALWNEFARRHEPSSTRRAIAPPRGNQAADEGDSGDDADPVSDSVGTPRLDAQGRSVPREFRDHSEEPVSEDLEGELSDG